nr:bile acid-CoA:amino acid N-acyltransferase isoform X2 [Ciona intestinalis]|eukprot:XP_018669878.1 bile acid-CoA:amino acid N-acyltransferase isoform X2 [Ciona intestinalis]
MYTGVEPMGLFWAMESSPLNRRPHNRLTKLNVETPQVYFLTVYDNEIHNLTTFHQIKKEKNLKKLASTHIKRWFMAAGTKRITLTVEKHGIHGTLFIPPGQGPFPGIIVMFGVVRATLEYKASLFASHGFAALALAFVDANGLPKFDYGNLGNNVELQFEYFEMAVKFMSNHKDVNSKNLAVFGSSMSGPIALAIGTHLRGITCVVWVNSTIILQSISLMYKGKKLLSTATYDMEKWEEEKMYRLMLRRTQQTPDDIMNQTFKDSLIKFYEKKDVAFLFVAGLEDANVPSEYHINQAENLLKLANHPNYKIVRCMGTGHLIEPPYTICNKSHGSFGTPYFSNFGGSKIPHCRNQENVWKGILQFLQQNLTKPLNKL